MQIGINNDYKKRHIGSNQVSLPNAFVPNLTENLWVSVTEKGLWIGSKERTVSKVRGKGDRVEKWGNEALPV